MAYTSITEKFEATRREEFSLMEDFTFKAVYGRGTPHTDRALIDLLNVILEDTDDEPIRTIKVKDPYIPGEDKKNKESYLDILTETDRHILISIEMQVNDYLSYPDRNLYYAGKVISKHALHRGHDYATMKKTIMITILDSKRYANGKLLCPYSVLEIDTHERLSDKLNFFFVQLQAVDMSKPVHELSPMETFAAYIRCAGDKEKAGYTEELLTHGKEYLESTEIVFDEVTRSDTMFFDREKHYIKISDNVTIQREMCEKAEAIGRARGETKEKHSIASRMIAMGMDTALIAEATGLTESEVKTIKQQ